MLVSDLCSSSRMHQHGWSSAHPTSPSLHRGLGNQLLQCQANGFNATKHLKMSYHSVPSLDTSGINTIRLSHEVNCEHLLNLGGDNWCRRPPPLLRDVFCIFTQIASIALLSNHLPSLSTTLGSLMSVLFLSGGGRLDLVLSWPEELALLCSVVHLFNGC